MISTYGDNEMWEITDVRPLWGECCKDLGIDPRLVKPYFLPRDEAPDWFDWSDCQLGEAWWEEVRCPEVAVFLYDFITGSWGLMDIRTIIYHELTHVILQEAGEEEVTQFADIITRRRAGWQYCRSYLGSQAFERKLGPAQESWTLFQWAKRKKLGFRKTAL
ncbi:hypothetical protein ES703_03474 [subsurface metagenome]